MLKHVVAEYVRTATPVSSDVIVRRYEPSVSSGAVRQQVLHLEAPATRDELDKVGNRLTVLLDELPAEQVARLSLTLDGIERQAAGSVARILEQADRQAFEDIYYEGLGHVL